jgi:hypothetical protein
MHDTDAESVTMNLFALYERVRPWDQSDTIVSIIVLTLLCLLVLLYRGRSFLANGAVLGAALGGLAAWDADTDLYQERMGYLDGGLMLGMLLGCAAKLILRLLGKKTQLGTHPTMPVHAANQKSQGPAFWTTLLAITGASFGLTLSLVFTSTYTGMALWMGGLVLTGSLIGAVIGFGSNRRWSGFQKHFELLVVIMLTMGIGAIIGWKFVFQALLYDNRLLEISETDLFSMVVIPCGALGALVGLIAWGVARKSARRLAP